MKARDSARQRMIVLEDSAAPLETCVGCVGGVVGVGGVGGVGTWPGAMGAARRCARTQHINISLSLFLSFSLSFSLSVAFALTATATQVFILQ